MKSFLEEHSLEPKKIPMKDQYQEAYGKFEQKVFSSD